MVGKHGYLEQLVLHHTAIIIYQLYIINSKFFIEFAATYPQLVHT